MKESLSTPSAEGLKADTAIKLRPLVMTSRSATASDLHRVDNAISLPGLGSLIARCPR